MLRAHFGTTAWAVLSFSFGLGLWSSGYPAWMGFAAWSLLLAALLFLTALVLLAREVCWCDAAHH
ncbi:conserved hypothetical protein [Xylella fastidiosa M12]|nr:conserved hypothetical protein [Xylella fastidiosa M12]